MLLWWLATTAFAEPCKEIPELTASAWDAFNDAELEQSKQILADANDALACQQDVVSTEGLLAVYRLDALVSLTQEDRKGAVYATIRAVTVDPKAAPSDDLGPELLDLHNTWATRLSDTMIEIRMEGAGGAWLDGRIIEAGNSIQALAGEHLIQTKNADGTFASGVQDLSTDLVLMTGGETPVADPKDPKDPKDPTDPKDPKDPIDPKPPKDPKPKKDPKPLNLKVPVVVVGGLAAAGGTAAVGIAWTWEQSFLQDTYNRPVFNECEVGEICYAEERRKTIVDDAKKIRGMYRIGYVSLGAGIAVAGTGLFVLPSPTADGGMLVLTKRW